MVDLARYGIVTSSSKKTSGERFLSEIPDSISKSPTTSSELMAGLGFQISIIAGKDKNSSSVDASGQVQHIITDEERDTFKLNDSQLKSAVNHNFGQTPKDAYLHDPTPWDNLYQKYNWTQTKTIMSVASAEILEITSEPVILKTQTFENSSFTEDVTYNASITDTVSNRVTSSWSTDNTLTVGQTIKYSVSFLGTGGGGESSLTYSHSWGKGGSETTTSTVGSSSGLAVTLGPRESLIAELTASRGVMKVRVRYNARLTGGTAINYNPIPTRVITFGA